jgi:hypothetical protein
MPKFQTRFAGVARQIQAATGIKYTDALRLLAPCKEELALADALRTAGLTAAAAVLTSVTLVCTENGAWYDAYGQIEAAFHETDLGKVEKTRAVCRQAAEAVMRRAGFQYAGFAPAAEVHHAAFLALCRAGAVPDGRRLARAALGVFDGDPLMCSDIVRSKGRRPFTYQKADNLSLMFNLGGSPDPLILVRSRDSRTAVLHASRCRATSREGTAAGEESRR